MVNPVISQAYICVFVCVGGGGGGEGEPSEFRSLYLRVGGLEGEPSELGGLYLCVCVSGGGGGGGLEGETQRAQRLVRSIFKPVDACAGSATRKWS